MKMESNTEGNLLEIMDLARTLRQEQLFIQHEQAAFGQLTETLAENSMSITKLAYICAQQRQNLNNLIISRPETGPTVCCRRANNYDNAKFIDAKKALDYEHAIAYEEFFNYLYRSPYLLATSLATGDRLQDITPQHMNYVIHTISSGLYGNAINTKDVEMILKLLRELIEIQIVASDNPRRLLRANSSSFARLYHRLNESMFSAKIFLTAALFDSIMGVLSDTDAVLDVDPNKVIQNFSSKERLRRFGAEDALDYNENVKRFHDETIRKLHSLTKTFIDNLTYNWSLFPSTLRWLVQTMCHHLKQAHFSEKIINEIITDMVFTHFICPAIVSPDIIGIIDAPISDQVRFNLMQIGQTIQMLALAKYDDVEPKFSEVYAKFEANKVTNLIDLLLVSQSGEDVVAILSQQSDFERTHLLSTQSELAYFIEFFRILLASEEYEITAEERQKITKTFSHLPDTHEVRHRFQSNGLDNTSTNNGEAIATNTNKERSKQSFMNLGKVTKSKIAKSMSFNTTNSSGPGGSGVPNGTTSLNLNSSLNISGTAESGILVNGGTITNGLLNGGTQNSLGQASLLQNELNVASANSSVNGSPVRSFQYEASENEPVLVFSIYNGEEHKMQPLTEEEVLKMNSIGQEISNDEALLVDPAESCNLENTIDKSSVANGFDAIDNMSDVLRPLHGKTARFSLSHDDASIGNSDNLEAVSEAPSNHSVTSSLELEENDQNDNLSDMVSANVSGRGTPNISGRDTPSSQVTDGESINALPTPQMQKLISKVRSDIEDKFCKFELKKFDGDETVSIISDTWSTDVLASDSETLDPGDRERDRDRNFSTPLIPSAVVLPGDNNFEALSNTGAGRQLYMDTSDRRSESNWSTDVLASDSEKLAEVDTDDNLSITAKSDITDAGIRADQERDQLAAAISAPPREDLRRNGNSSYYASRGGYGGASRGGGVGGGVGILGGNAIGDGGHSSGSSGGNASDRSQEDSAFFDAVNFYDDPPTAAAVASGYSAASLHHYQGLSSLARSSASATSNYGGENSFQQNYKSSSSHEGSKESFLVTPRMRRQTSAESSISNQSLNLEEAAAANKLPKGYYYHPKGAMKKKKQHNNGNHSHNHNHNHHGHNNSISSPHSKHANDSKDLIDFSDFVDEKPGPGNSNPNTIELVDMFNIRVSNGSADDGVERRLNATEQRSTVYDGRRNGILALKGGRASTGDNATPSLRRHQSLNYENHEIMINTVVTKRVSAAPILKDSIQTDDDKRQQQQQQEQEANQQQELLLCAKTDAIDINGENVAVLAEGENDEFIGISDDLTTSTPSNHLITATTSDLLVASNTNGLTKPTKSTGAIPKSISFDASADKNSNTTSGIRSSLTQRGPRTHDSLRFGATNTTHHHHHAAPNSGIFNKLKQGFFKHRRSYKSTQHRPTQTTNPTPLDELSPNSRSVSFSTNASEVSLDLISGRNKASGFGDISEDILAKYRRKVSTSSEATNSDSTGNGGGLANRKNSDAADIKIPSAATLQHDKTVTFNVIKKKIRTVLSKTDLHTGDFRHTTYSNASPLLTYLQIQYAQATNLQNFKQISYVTEAIRCISTLEPTQHTQLLAELQNDIQKRQNYLQYLMRYRQNLLLIMENIEQFETRLRSESTICNRYLMAICVRLFLEKRQTKIEAFQEEFSRLTVSDDKIDLIEEFIDNLMAELLEKNGILYGMPDWQTQEARIAIERILLQRMYQQVMFPNEDADLSRDIVLYEHIRKLQNVIRPSHPALCIPQEYLAEAPWTFAQQQLSYITAYQTPKEKLQCVIRCISSIMSLLQMSSGRIPAADDVLPVLIYVVIMANPPYLLSTIEYITCFIGEKIDGEELFHWTLFGSVVKFIKTMDYLD